MGKHFNRIPRIGVSYWDRAMPSYLYQIIYHNANYFDKYYLISTEFEGVFNSSKIEVIRTTKQAIIDFTHLKISNGLNSRMLKESSALFSDLVCLFPHDLLYAYTQEKFDRLMYIDTNSIIWNQLLVNELFSTNHYPIIDGRRRLMKEEGSYLVNNYDSYLSTSFSLSDKCETPEVTDKFRYYLLNYLERRVSNLRYTVLGPSLLNTQSVSIMKEEYNLECLPIVSNGLDPQLLHTGVMRGEHIKHSLGYSISNTLNSEAGYKVLDIQLRDDNSCLIYIGYDESEN